MNYEWLVYDVWGNENDGWDVNGAYRTGLTLYITEATTDDEIIVQLFDKDAIAKVEIDPHSPERSIYLRVRATMRPLGELRQVRE